MNVQPIRKHSPNNASFKAHLMPTAKNLLYGHLAEIAMKGTISEIMQTRRYMQIIQNTGNRKDISLDARSILNCSINPRNNVPIQKTHLESYFVKLLNGEEKPIFEVNNLKEKISPVQKLKKIANALTKITQ